MVTVRGNTSFREPCEEGSLGILVALPCTVLLVDPLLMVVILSRRSCKLNLMTVMFALAGFSCAHVTEKMFAASVSLSAQSSFPCQRDGYGVSGVGFSERYSNTGDMRIVGVSVCCVEPRNLCLVYDSRSTASVPRVRITEATVQVSKFDVWQ